MSLYHRFFVKMSVHCAAVKCSMQLLQKICYSSIVAVRVCICRKLLSRPKDIVKIAGSVYLIDFCLIVVLVCLLRDLHVYNYILRELL